MGQSFLQTRYQLAEALRRFESQEEVCSVDQHGHGERLYVQAPTQADQVVFHGAPLGYACDFLAIALTDVASIAERRSTPNSFARLGPSELSNPQLHPAGRASGATVRRAGRNRTRRPAVCSALVRTATPTISTLRSTSDERHRASVPPSAP